MRMTKYEVDANETVLGLLIQAAHEAALNDAIEFTLDHLLRALARQPDGPWQLQRAAWQHEHEAERERVAGEPVEVPAIAVASALVGRFPTTTLFPWLEVAAGEFERLNYAFAQSDGTFDFWYVKGKEAIKINRSANDELTVRWSAPS